MPGGKQLRESRKGERTENSRRPRVVPEGRGVIAQGGHDEPRQEEKNGNLGNKKCEPGFVAA